MDQTINRTIIEYVKLVREKYSDIEGVYVFGSYVKGNSNQESDIDLALIFKNLDDSERFDVQVQLMLLASQVDTRIEPHPISHDDFYSKKPFANEIRKTGFELTEKTT